MCWRSTDRWWARPPWPRNTTWMWWTAGAALTASIEIARVVVDRSCAGQGYAVKMLALLLEELKVSGCCMVHLAVGCHHGAAIRTYEKLGFTFLKQCPLFGHDYYLCEKAL